MVKEPQWLWAVRLVRRGFLSESGFDGRQQASYVDDVMVLLWLRNVDLAHKLVQSADKLT